VTFCRLGARDLGNDENLDHILRKGNAGSPAPAGCRRYAECRHAPPLRYEPPSIGCERRRYARDHHPSPS
jgi:hypothetical protein